MESAKRDAVSTTRAIMSTRADHGESPRAESGS
jgi:hypothetical protein